MEKGKRVAAIVGIGTIALLILVLRKKKKPEPQQEPVVVQSQPKEPSTPNEFLKKVVQEVLQEGKFSTPGRFLSNLTERATKEIKDWSWFSVFPKYIEEIEEKLQEIGMWEEYQRVLEVKNPRELRSLRVFV